MSTNLTQSCDGAIAASADANVRRPGRPRAVLAATILASSLAFIDGSVLNVALPAIGAAFEASAAEVQWVINAFLLPLSALILIGGAMADLYGRKRLLIVGTGLFTLASLICALAPSLEIFLAARVLQGLGAAMLMPSSLAILGSTFTGEERGRAVGTWAAVGAAAGALGPLLGGWLVDAAGWRAIFLINLPIAAAAIGIAAWAVEESGSAERPKPDWTGGMLATTGLAALTWGLTEASAKGGAGASSAVAMAAGVMLLAAFVLVERRRGDRAMVPLTLFGSRGFTGLTLLTFLLYGALGVLMVVLPYVLIEAGGYTALEAGAALLPLPTIIALASPWLGRAAARLGPRLPLSVGPALVAGGFLLAAALGIGGSYWQSVFPAVLLVAIGMAAAVAPLTSAVLASVDAGHQGTASGLNSAVARTGGLIATALLGFVFAEQVQALVGSFRAAALAGAAVCVLASLSGFLLLERRSVAAV